MARLKTFYTADEITNNLYTSGSEYMTEDNVEYVGSYHSYATGERYTNQTLKVTVSKTEFETTYNFTPEVGDIITDQSKYYEISSIDRKFVTLPGTGTASSTIGGATNTPGFIVLYVLSAYLVRTSKLNILKYST